MAFEVESSEDTHLRLKPMIETGGNPILWRILKIYLHHSIKHIRPRNTWPTIPARVGCHLRHEK